jgi:MFS family permease
VRPKNPFRELPSEVAALTAVSFSVAVGFGVVAPAIPLFARTFGVGSAAVGAVLSAFALMRLVSALMAGRLVDRLGERTMLATGIGIVAVSSALAAFSTSYVQLLVLRGAGGVGSAMFSVSAMSLLLRSVRADQRGQATGLFQGGFLVGGISGPAVGGVLATISIRAPFLIYAVTLAGAGAVGLWALRNTSHPARVGLSASTERTPLKVAFRNAGYRAALAANLADQWAVIGVRSALVPLFVVESLHRSSTWVGAGFVIVAGFNALALLKAGRIADTRGRKPVLVTGCLTMAASLLLLATAGDLLLYLAAMVLLGLGSGMLSVAPAAIVGDVAGGRGGTVVAAYQMAGDAGAVTGPVVAGWLADQTSFSASFVLSAGVLGAAGALAALTPGLVRKAQVEVT